MDDLEFIDLMEELRLALNASEVERYSFFISHSTEGRECSYAAKCLKLFKIKDQRRLLEDILRRWDQGRQPLSDGTLQWAKS